MPRIQTHQHIEYPSEKTAIDRLLDYSMTGSSAVMRKQMVDDTFVLKDIAILGQWTTIYASPNTGKTLLTLWLLNEALQSGSIDGEYVFYVNADDTHKGLVEKTELAEHWGFQVVSPHHKQFKSSYVIELMTDLVKENSARGVVLILDTLKKFTDLMHKKESAEFGEVARAFVSSGGTIICLAHTNKHKAADGRSIYGGTSDIRDDSDCVYIMDKISGTQSEGTTAVEFHNNKARGDVAEKVAFKYKRFAGQSYQDLIKTVERIEEPHLQQIKSEISAQKQLDEDSELISAISDVIRKGVTAKTAIVKEVNGDTGIPQTRIRQVLTRRTGNVYSLGHRWNYSVGQHNKAEFLLITARGAQTEKLHN